MEHHSGFSNKERVDLYRGWALVLFLLVASFGVWKVAESYSDRVDPVSFRSFGVSGEAKASIVPDIAEFTFSVVTEGGKELAELQLENTNRMNSALAFLKQNGVDEKDIKTQQYNVSPRYQYSACSTGVCPPPQIVGYSVTQSVLVKARDFGKVGELLSGVVKNGANSVSEMRFTVDDATDAHGVARAEAIAKAKTKAEGIAHAGGFKLGRLLSIDEGISGVPYASSYARFGMGGDAMMEKAPTIAPGVDETTIVVNLRYEIRD